ncbi:MAG: hypothetical protein NC433_05480 [Clostridiales bacterium]|nr:hypothetical protein [Clostridiales bacterium]
MKEKRTRTPQQIAALICIVILIGMYIITFIAACLDFPNSDRLFAVCLFASIGLPILIWVYIQLYTITKKKRDAAKSENENTQQDK